jgi:hypothetical protein
MMMKTNEHPITPPPELVEQWTALANEEEGCKVWHAIATQAACWGADQELKACCLLLDDGEHAASYGCHNGTSLRAARRPKPPSLKEQALNDLALMDATLSALRRAGLDAVDENTIRRALESLPND